MTELSSFLEEILFVIVLYKKKPEQSQAFISLQAVLKNSLAHASIFLYDNSPEVSNVYDDGVIYRHDPANNGVSKAYNEASTVALKLNKKWMLLLDQDTITNNNFLQKLFDDSQVNFESVAFVPKLKDQYGLVSPFRWVLGKGKRIIPRHHALSLDKFRFANSGLLIRLDAFLKAGGYEETIMLDFSDIAFGEKLKKITSHFTIVDIELEHSFSGSLHEPHPEASARFNTFCLGAFGMSKTFGSFYIYFVRSFLRSIKLSLLYKKINFVKIFLQHAIHG